MNASPLPHRPATSPTRAPTAPFRWILTATALFVLVTPAGAALSMLWVAAACWRTKASTTLSTDWNPVEDKYGALVPIYGTIVTVVIAMLIAVPVSFGIAFFLTEVPRWWHADRHGDRTAGRHPLDHLRHVGLLRCR